MLLFSISPASADTIDKYFYCIYQEDNHIDPTGPISLKPHEIMDLAFRVSEGKNNFIGFEDGKGDTIQFYTQELNQIWVDIPSAKENGSYGKLVNNDEFYDIIMKLKKPYKKYISTLNLEFQAW